MRPARIRVWRSSPARGKCSPTRHFVHKPHKEHTENRRDDDRRGDHHRLARIEHDIHDMRNLILKAFLRRSGN